MELEQLAKKMEEDGYQRIASNVEQITLFLKREGEKTCGVCLVDDRTGILDGSAMFETVMKKTEEKLKDCEHDLLALIVTNDVEREKLHQESSYAFWLLDVVGGRRIVFERAISESWFGGDCRGCFGSDERGVGSRGRAGPKKRRRRCGSRKAESILPLGLFPPGGVEKLSLFCEYGDHSLECGDVCLDGAVAGRSGSVAVPPWRSVCGRIF